MASHSPTDEPLKELKHDAVPGYMRAFIIAFAAMTLYLVIVLIVSPGRTKGHHDSDHGHDDQHSTKSEAAHHDSH